MPDETLINDINEFPSKLAYHLFEFEINSLTQSITGAVIDLQENNEIEADIKELYINDLTEWLDYLGNITELLKKSIECKDLALRLLYQLYLYIQVKSLKSFFNDKLADIHAYQDRQAIESKFNDLETYICQLELSIQELKEKSD